MRRGALSEFLDSIQANPERWTAESAIELRVVALTQIFDDVGGRFPLSPQVITEILNREVALAKTFTMPRALIQEYLDTLEQLRESKLR